MGTVFVSLLIFASVTMLTACGDNDPQTNGALGVVPLVLDGEFVLDAAESNITYVVDIELDGAKGKSTEGRTSTISGAMTWEDNAVTAVNVCVDLATLDSGVPLQDDLVRRSLTGSTTAEFTGEGATSFGDRLVQGETYSPLFARGTFSLNGVARDVRFEDLRLITETGGVRFQGNVPIRLADYNILVPTSEYVVGETATISVDLLFRSTSSP